MAGPVVATGAEPKPVSVQTAPGQFEIAAIDASAAHLVAVAAEEAWRWLAVPLALPPAFSSPIYVRLIPVAEAIDPVPFRVTVEPGGIVSVRLTVGTTITALVQRALVQGLLMRLAVARHGVRQQLTAPLWLEHACVGWWQTHAETAQLDALKQESMSLPPPRLNALLTWQRGTGEPRLLSATALWLLTFLQSESARGREWPDLLQRLLGGEEPLAALGASYPDRFANPELRELWWQTGYHQVRRIRTLPSLEAADSRAQLAALARFVFAGAAGDVDVAVPLRSVRAHLDEPIVAAELARRTADLERLTPALHPIYRNAGLSLAEVFRLRSKTIAKHEVLCAAFEQDLRDAMELEAAITAALNELEGTLRPVSGAQR